MKRNCPICKAPADSEKDKEFPFCSERCRMLDLGAWASERYVVSESIFDEEEIPEEDRRALHQPKRNTDDVIH